jgi:hypothetical protein
MPQGDDSAKSEGAPRSSTYQRKRVNVRRSGAKGVGGLAAQINPNFLKSLPSITRNIEQLTAGKLLQSGLGLHMTDIRASGKSEMKAKGKKRRRVNPISALLLRGKNLKGVKGEFDTEELAALDPELRTMLAHRKASSGAGGSGSAKTRKVEGGSGGQAAGGGGSSSGGGVMPAPSGEGGAGGGKKGGGGGRGRAQALSAPLAPRGEAKGVFATDAEVKDAFGDDFL